MVMMVACDGRWEEKITILFGYYSQAAKRDGLREDWGDRAEDVPAIYQSNPV